MRYRMPPGGRFAPQPHRAQPAWGSRYRGNRTVAKPVKFAHVVYMTRRFDEMIAWYRDVFEADVVYENPALAFLTYDDEHHRFAFANLDVLKPESVARGERGEIGVNHVAYTYGSVGDLLSTYARLKAASIHPY